jgi:hypothetical protein
MNDQFHFAYTNPGTLQFLELPGQAAAHAAVETPLATTDDSAVSLASNFSSPALPTAVQDANAGDAAHIHRAAAEPSSTIDPAGAAVAQSGASSSPGAASGDMNDQFHFAYTNPGALQSLELPSQAGAHAAVAETPLATTDDSAISLASNFNSPALPTAVQDANGDDAAPIHSAAAEPSSTIHPAGAAVAQSGASSSPGAASGDMNDQFHFAYTNSGTLQSLELPNQAAAPAAVEIPPATTHLAQILDDILTHATQAPLDTVPTPAQNHDVASTNAHHDTPSSNFIIHA